MEEKSKGHCSHDSRQRGQQQGFHRSITTLVQIPGHIEHAARKQGRELPQMDEGCEAQQESRKPVAMACQCPQGKQHIAQADRPVGKDAGPDMDGVGAEKGAVNFQQDEEHRAVTNERAFRELDTPEIHGDGGGREKENVAQPIGPERTGGKIHERGEAIGLEAEQTMDVLIEGVSLGKGNLPENHLGKLVVFVPANTAQCNRYDGEDTPEESAATYRIASKQGYFRFIFHRESSVGQGASMGNELS